VTSRIGGGTSYSEASLSLLPGYPRTERLGDRPGENPNLVLIDEGFTPFHEAEQRCRRPESRPARLPKSRVLASLCDGPTSRSNPGPPSGA